MSRNGGAGAHCIDGEGLIPGVFLYRRGTASDSGMPANRIERTGAGGIGRSNARMVVQSASLIEA